MKIYLDDVRDCPNGWEVARTGEAFKSLITQLCAEGASIEAISFDNDLGEGEPEGRHLMQWLSQEYPEYLVSDGIEISIHSANPVANEHMRSFLENCRKHKELLLSQKDRPDPWADQPMR